MDPIAYLSRAPIEHMDMLEALRRGQGQLLASEAEGVAICVCGNIGMLSASSVDAQERLIRHIAGFPLLAVHQEESAAMLRLRRPDLFMMRCHQAVYEHSSVDVPRIPAIHLQPLTMAECDEVAELYAQYHDPSEIPPQIKLGAMLGAFDGDRLAGFIGLHEEGSMGMLQVVEAYRRRGIAALLEAELISRELSKGHIPFCQVIQGNQASLALQQKIGLTVTERPCVTWLMEE